MVFFSVAFMYGGGHSIRSVTAIFIDIPLTTLKYTPGETRSLTLAAWTGVMRSPGWTSAKEGAEIARSPNARRYPARLFIDFNLDMLESPQLARQQTVQDLRLRGRRTDAANNHARNFLAHLENRFERLERIGRVQGRNAAQCVAFRYASKPVVAASLRVQLCLCNWQCNVKPSA
jgi:hypothetical protein